MLGRGLPLYKDWGLRPRPSAQGEGDAGLTDQHDKVHPPSLLLSEVRRLFGAAVRLAVAPTAYCGQRLQWPCNSILAPVVRELEPRL